MPFTRDQLVDLARKSGLQCSARLITEWAQIGILDQPERVGRSDGKRGAYYLWPDTQKDLLLTVLAKRGEVRHIKSLVQVPVGIWMYWGDEWVPIRQVRRALTTSTGLFGPPNSYERALANAREVVRGLRREGVSRGEMNELRDELAGQLHRGRIDPDVLRPLIEVIVSTDPRTGGWGPFGLGVDEIVTWIQATVVAVAQLESVSDGQLHESRARQRLALLNLREIMEEPRADARIRPDVRRADIGAVHESLLSRICCSISAFSWWPTKMDGNCRPSRSLIGTSPHWI